MKRKNGTINKALGTETKDHVFQSIEAAEQAYQEACSIINDKFFMEAKSLVTQIGNIIRVPAWFPFSPAVN